ncbi:oxygen-independent coproporphyrinogen III oxidase [bacterium]|nr:oxygen-independent coproporphyrinogen III oxidase [bacterium]
MDNYKLSIQTIHKFNVPGPRYTSYPTAPEWKNDFTENDYPQILQDFDKKDEPLSIYVHIPFCESLCWYCGCNVVIKKDRKHANSYLDYLEKEIDKVASNFSKKKKAIQFHWGGGTPTFLTSEQITRLFTKIKNTFELDFDGEIAIEIDPRTIDKEKILLLKNLGFNRVSMGVQDFNPVVQQAVHRIQPYEMVKDYVEFCRKLGFVSINLDLIYGLPFQTAENFSDSVYKTCELRPDRVALYSYAHLPWLKKHMALIKDENLPKVEEKFQIFLRSREIFLENGYSTIAMDHFALKTDEMAKAFENGTLYRNFMGYTLKPAETFLGFGVSSIGFMENSFVQNAKELETYYSMLDSDKLPLERVKKLSRDDLVRKWVINALMCQFAVDKIEFKKQFDRDFDVYFDYEKEHIANCVSDKLIELSENKIEVTQIGRLFVRNVCMGFDWYFRQQNGYKKFSKTV